MSLKYYNKQPAAVCDFVHVRLRKCCFRSAVLTKKTSTYNGMTSSHDNDDVNDGQIYEVSWCVG